MKNKILFLALFSFFSFSSAFGEIRWVNSVSGFSSQWSHTTWSANQVIGEPNTYPAYGDITTSWASAGGGDIQREWLNLVYLNPEPISSIAIYETYHPGAIDTIYVKNPGTGQWEMVWSGTSYDAPQVSRCFVVDFPLTTFPVSEIRIAINSPEVTSWNEIDAVAIADFSLESYSLPVELSSFTVSASGNTALLKWETTSETNNAGFEILKSEDVTLSANEVSVSKGRSQKSGWKTIGFVNGKGTTTEKQTYSFSDPSPFTTRSSGTGSDFSPVFYQLKQIDTDGKTSLSQILSFIATPVSFEVVGNYPNPFNPSTVIKFNLPEVSTVVVKVHNIIGQEIAVLVNGKMDAGVKEIRFNAKGLSSGLYFYSVSANGTTFTRSMTLLK
ncbi:MAG: T9SS type A sorting domain-containing protein [Bacteroidetes bacterium]|nr:T9SS type A sorting domain-containing protein [Bacteroidota bacterium]